LGESVKLKTIFWILWASWILVAAFIAGVVFMVFGNAPGILTFAILVIAPLWGSGGGSYSGGDFCEYFQEDDHG